MARPWPFKGIQPDMLAQMYDDHHEGVFVVDSEAYFVYYNQRMAALDGFTLYEVPGMRFQDIYYSLDENSSATLGCLKSRMPVKELPVYYRTRMGALVNSVCSAYPLFEDGRLVGSICFAVDYSNTMTTLNTMAHNYIRHPATSSDVSDQAPKESLLTFAALIGESPAFIKAVERAKLAAQHPAAVLLVGETGSGKELFAQAIHNHGHRLDQKFVPINCAAIPETLLESLLFGSTKGAFTDSLDKPGLFEVASGGTVFLDEINSMPPMLQSKLLRVIQEQKVSRLGSTKETAVDLKIISATSENPYRDISAGRLRQDLFYRLGAVVIYIPPLQQRREDIKLLLTYFIKKHNRRFKGRTLGVTTEALEWLETRGWPGNVRELEHTVESALLFAGKVPYLGLEHFLNQDLALLSQAAQDDPQNQLSPVSGRRSGDRNGTEPGMRKALEDDPARQAGPPSTLGDFQTAKKELLTEERKLILKTFEEVGRRKSKAAAALGLSRQLFQYKWNKIMADQSDQANSEETAPKNS